MFKIPENVTKFIVAYGINPLLIGLFSSTVVALGRSFVEFAKTTSVHAGWMGGAQAIMVIWMMRSLPEYHSNVTRLLQFGACHIVSGFLIFVVSAIAFQAGLISSSVTLPGMMLLSLANCAFSYGNLKFWEMIVEQMQRHQLI